MPEEYVEVWLASVDDWDESTAEVFATENEVYDWLWERYGDEWAYWHHDREPRQRPESFEEWLNSWQSEHEGGQETPGNASWLPIKLPLSKLRRVDAP